MPVGSLTLFIQAPGTATSLKQIQYDLIKAAYDENTSASATIGVGSGNIPISVVDSARLQLTVISDDTVSQGQVFPVRVRVENLGTSNIVPDSIKTRVNFANISGIEMLNPADSVAYIRLINGVGEKMYELRVLGNSGTPNLTADISVDDVVSDENNYSTKPVAKINPVVSKTIRLVPAGAISSVVSIISPPGAQDGVLSTRQFFTVRANIVINSTVADQGRVATIQVPEGYFINGVSTVNLSDSLQSNYDVKWEIQAPNSARNNDLILITVKGTNKFTGEEISIQKTLNVNVVQRAKLSFVSQVMAPVGATDGEVSTLQRFLWNLNLVNSGTALTIDSSVVQLDLQGTGYFLDANRTIQLSTIKLWPGSPRTVVIWTDTQPHGLESIVATVIDTSRDENNNQPAELVNNTQTLTSRIVNRASLSISVFGPALVDTLQNFDVVARVVNKGDAGIIPDSVKIEITNANSWSGIELATGETTVKFVKLVQGVGTASFRLHSLQDSTDDVIRLTITDTDVSDENDFPNNTVYKEQPSAEMDVSVRVGVVQVVHEISAPAGATDGILSTGQKFTLQADIVFKENVDSVGRSVTLEVPSGFTISQATTIPLNYSDTIQTVTWDVFAPLNQTGDYSITVKAFGKDKFSNQTLQAFHSLPVSVVSRSRLAIEANIINPVGARDSVLSTQQLFDVSVIVRNEGNAGTFGNNQIKITFPPGFQILSSGNNEAVFQISTNSPVSFSVRSPDTPTPLSGRNVIVSIETPAFDENTNQAAELSKAQDELKLVVVKRAVLNIASLTFSQDSVMQGQAFTVSTQITNLGDAHLEPDDSVQVRLFYDTAIFDLAEGENPVKRARLNNRIASINWSLKAKQNASSGSSTFTVQIDTNYSYDENIHPDSTIATTAAQFSRDITVLNLGQLSVQSVYFLNNNKDSLIVSTDQSNIHVRLKANLHPLFLVNQTANAFLEIPPQLGFSTDSSLTRKLKSDSTAQWFLKAPSQKLDWTPLKIKVYAQSPLNPTVMIEDSQFVYIKVVRKATLSVEASIVSPTGARDDTVSFGQSFVFRAVVQNTGEADVLSNPRGQLKFQLGNLFSSQGGQTLTLPFTVGEPVDITVDVATTGIVGKLQARIQELQNQKRIILTRFSNVNAANSQEIPEKKAVEEIDTRLSSLYNQLASIIDSSLIKVSIDKIPFDENTQDSAFVSKRNFEKRIFIQEQAFISVVNWQLPVVWSTNQESTIQVEVESPANVINKQATLILPDGFVNPEPTKIFNGNSVSWVVRSPAEKGSWNTDTAKVIIQGFDKNTSDNFVSARQDTLITLQTQARLKISGGITRPPASKDGKVSRRQKFTLTAVVENIGEAGTTGQGSLKIDFDPNIFSLAEGQPEVLSFTSLPATLAWELVSLDTNATSLIRINFVDLPKDKNSSTPAALDPENNQLVVSVSIVSKRLFVSQLTDVKPQPNYIQGAKSVPVLGLAITNPELNPEDTIFVNQMTLSVKDPVTLEFLSKIVNLISRVKIVNYNSNWQLGKGNGSPDIFADVAITDTTGNPFSIKFDVTDTVLANETDKLVVLVDLASKAPNRNFQVFLEDLRAFQLVEGNPFFVDVTDSIGNPINTVGVETPPISVVSSDPGETFGNYPNPFGVNDGQTKFVFFMENDGDAEIFIFTLLGELVWHDKREGLKRGLYDGEITWDGTNDKGQTVLNGVYLGVLKVKYRSGASKSYKTKIAFIK